MRKKMMIKIRVEEGRHPRYAKGARYCTKCEVVFYPEPRTILLKRCLFCGGQLRTLPKRRQEKEKLVEIKRIDPDKYLFSE